VTTRDVSTLSQALSLLDEWIEAYEELRRDNMRLLARYLSTKTDLEHARAAIANDLWLDERLAKPIESECPF